jgi:hypothetical protein
MYLHRLQSNLCADALVFFARPFVSPYLEICEWPRVAVPEPRQYTRFPLFSIVRLLCPGFGLPQSCSLVLEVHLPSRKLNFYRCSRDALPRLAGHPPSVSGIFERRLFLFSSHLFQL